MSDTDAIKLAPPQEDSKRDILSTYMVNPKISLLDKVKIQAQVLLPLLRAFRAALGKERATQIVRSPLREWPQQLFHDIGKQIDGVPKKKWATLSAAITPKANENVDLEILRQDREALDVNVIGCR